ncbi:MAG: V-type ATP synthase subunit F [Planctomycetota bacterium]
MSKIFIIGDRDKIFPFKAVGAKLLPVSTAEESHKVWHELKSEKEKFLAFLTPEAYALGHKEVNAVREKGINTIIVLPFAVGDSEPGLEEMRTQLARAIGVDLIGKKSSKTE